MLYLLFILLFYLADDGEMVGKTDFPVNESSARSECRGAHDVVNPHEHSVAIV